MYVKIKVLEGRSPDVYLSRKRVTFMIGRYDSFDWKYYDGDGQLWRMVGALISRRHTERKIEWL